MILGIDFGSSKVGIAVLDEKAGTPALPVTVLSLRPDKIFYNTFKNILSEYPSEEIVVGNPFTSFPPSQEQRVSFENFLEGVEKISKIKPVLYDESGTTREAQHVIKDHPKKLKNDDAIAASIMLEAYAQHKKNVALS